MQQATLSHRLINFKKERNFSQKLNATFEFLSQHFKPIGKNLLLIAGPFALLTGICYAIYQTYTMGAAMAGASGEITGDVLPNVPFMMGAMGAMIFFSFISLTLVVAIVMRHIQQYVSEGHAYIATAQLWSSIGKDFLRVAGTTFVLLIALSISIGIIALPLIFLARGNSNPVLIFFSLLGLFLAILILVPALMLLYPIRSMEGVGIFTAFGRLFTLISGKWWSTAGLVWVVNIIQSVIAVIFAIPMYTMLVLQILHSTEAGPAAEASGGLYDILFSLASGLSMLGSFALYSILFIAVTFQYYNLVERKEATGLLERLESFGVQKTDPHDEDEHY